MLTKSDITKSKIYPVLVLESIVSERNLRRLTKALQVFFLFFVIVTLGGALVISRMGLSNAAEWNHWLELKLLGLLCLVLALMIVIMMMRSYLRSSYYFENVLNNRYNSKDLYTFTVGRILYRTKGDDWLAGFLRSEVGRMIMLRAGIGPEQSESFLAGRPLKPSSLVLSTDKLLKLRDFVAALYEDNADWQKLLSAAGLAPADLLAITDWVVKGIEADELRVRWWRRENLDRIGSVGKSWSYGQTPKLDVFSEDLLDRPEAQYSAYEVPFRDREVKQLENVLARQSESNVLLVGENEPVRMDVLWSFIKQIKHGTVLPRLEHKRVLMFNNSLFLSTFKERAPFEQEMVKMMDEAIAAGDVILVFNDFANFLSGAENMQSQIFSLLDQYFAHSRLQVIALSDTDKFHRSLEPRSEVMARFERVIVAELSPEETVATLLSSVDGIEAKNGVTFTYQALKQVVNSAETYLEEGSLSDKARDLIIELVPWMIQAGKPYILPGDVLSYLSQKTNIPAGEITAKEQTVLLNLENVLHERVIGQSEAVSAVASAMKRARAGIQNAKRPLGSFLFLGPTGVGKTETAKALAAAYFGSEDKLMRLDMTEYQDAGSLDKLIGSFNSGKPGVLSNMIRQNVFGVLLLDEFEKTDPDVLNLFLQILDEGFFSDMDGKKVNTRNIIFIATSNAGASSIWNMVKAGKDPAAAKDEIVNEIVQTGTYKPELLNRFDEVVIFHPLTPENLKQIAGLMLKKLVKRLEPKGIKLTVNDELTEKVSREGANEVFGARPMNRYIQDKIEQLIADKIIEGALKPGATIEFSQTAPSGIIIS